MNSKFSIISGLLSLVLFSSLLANNNGVRILKSDSRSIIIEFTPNYLDTITHNVSEPNSYSFDIYNSLYDLENTNSYYLPFFSLNVSVPKTHGNILKILDAQFDFMDGQIYHDEITTSDNKYLFDDNNIHLEEVARLRDFLIQEINIFPITYNPSQARIKLCKKITFEISYSDYDANPKPADDNFLQNIILNYNEARYWIKNEPRLQKAKQSKLASGIWYKFDITDEGIYKIERSDLLKYGIDPSTVDPRTIKIFNNGGYVLDENPQNSRPLGLIENSIIVSGESDGKFDLGDYVLFYGRGSEFWEYTSNAGEIKRIKHPYSKKNTYWITSGGTIGKRMTKISSNSENIDYTQSSTKAYKFVDEDKTNIMRTGRLYVGDEFTQSVNSHTYLNSLDDRINSTPIRYNFEFVYFSPKYDESNYSAPYVPLSVEENGTSIFYQNVRRAFGSYRLGSIIRRGALFNGALPNNRSILKFTFNSTFSQVTGHLNFFEIEYEKNLNAVNNTLEFFSEDTTGNVSYTINNFMNSDIIVFDVSEFDSVKIIEPELLSGGQFRFRRQESAGSITKYYAITKDEIKIPTEAVQVQRTNLIGDINGADYVIITDRKFTQSAERLESFRSSHGKYPLNAKTIFIDDILNEFSAGLLDPTAIRDFLQYAYENWAVKPFYVLLFGDGDYDYFNLEGLNKNFIPTFQTLESLHYVEGYPYDDYYTRISGNDIKADLAIGRINIQSNAQGEIAVDKIINYETNSKIGLWQNRIILLADDGLTTEGNDWNLHTQQSETLANFYIPKYYSNKKIYLAEYPEVNTGRGRRKPTVNQALMDAIQEGALILNFIGHGNPEVWTHENVFTRETSIPQLRNENLFFLTAATCDFGKYDDPTEQSGTEMMLLMKDAGMIAGFSASRPVYSNSNAALNNIFYNNLLFNKDSHNLPVTIGEAYFNTKRIRTLNNDERFHLFGDPALRLKIPINTILIDSLNHVSTDSLIQLKALSSASLSGKVRKYDNTNYSNYDGEGIVTVYDSERKTYLSEINYNVSTQGGVIFRGRTSISNGSFTTNFIVPKDISYENKNGKITIYSFNDDENGIGFTDNFVVGGTDTTNINDTKGPQISIYFDSEEYGDASLVNKNFELIVSLSDQTGINTTGSGIGHKLEAILDDNEAKSIDLSNNFIGDLDSGGKSGKIQYPFNNLSTGKHSIKVKAWDIFNNLSESIKEFTIVDGKLLSLQTVLNYPNPFSDGTYFTFQHNALSAVNVKIKIYTVSGRLIKVIEKNNLSSRNVRIYWDGKDEDRNSLANGSYFYKVNIESIDGLLNENAIGKLAVIK